MLFSERRKVADFMRRLYRQGLTTASGGNISSRVDGGRIVLTPSQTDKGCMRGEDVGVLGPDGANLTPALKPSIETSLHREIYRQSARVNAVVHAHPVTASALSATGRQINTHLICEAYAVAGDPVKVPYACMGSDELADMVCAATERASCVVMENHGALTIGGSLLEAFNRMEVLETAAKQTVLTDLTGDVQPLSGEQLSALDELLGRG